MIDHMSIRRAVLAVPLAIGLHPGGGARAEAAIVSYDFTGSVTYASPVLTSAAIGDALSGSYSVDDSAAATPASDTVSAAFNALTALDLTLGAYYSASSAGAPEVQVGNQGTDGPSTEVTDRYAVVARAGDGLTGPALDGLALDTFGFRMDDSTGTLFGSANGPLPTAINLTDFDIGGLFFVFFANGGFMIGDLTSLVPLGVPEPASLALLTACLLGLAAARRRPA